MKRIFNPVVENRFFLLNHWKRNSVLFLLLFLLTIYIVGCHWDRVPLPENPKAGDLWEIEINGLPYRFRWCPPGEFFMGWTERERQDYEEYVRPFHPYSEIELKQDVEREMKEHNPHRVIFTKGFWILETEVTQQMFENIMGGNNSRFQGSLLPVESVNFHDCHKFAEELNRFCKLSGKNKFYLPSEEEWEYACRAGSQTVYNYGDEVDHSKMNSPGYTTQEVGSYPPNNWGIYDMHGNVAEYCNEIKVDYPDKEEIDPPHSFWEAIRGHGLTAYLVLSMAYFLPPLNQIITRGGSWNNANATSGDRGSIIELSSADDVGFRIVIDSRKYDY